MHVIDSLAVGGAERMLITLANRSHADGLNVSVCATRSAGPLADNLDYRIPFWVLPRGRRIDPKSFAALGRYASGTRTQIFHVHGRSSFSFLATAKTAGTVDAPIVLHDHNGAAEPDRRVPAWMSWWGAALVGQYVSATDRAAGWAERARVPNERIQVIENGIEIVRRPSRLSRDVRRQPLAALGRLTGIVAANLRPEKGIDVLLQALARVAHSHRPQVWICGAVRDADYDLRCRELTGSLGLGESIRFIGERCDIPRLAALADFAVVPSISESGPLVLAEFMAAGLPLVATEAGSLARRARDLGLRDIVPPGNADALAGALERLLALTPTERLARGEAGRILAERHFDITALMPRWYRVYEEALRNGGR